MRLLLKRGRCLSWVSLRKTRRRPASRSARVQRCFCAKVRLLSVWDGAVALRKTTPISHAVFQNQGFSGFQHVDMSCHVLHHQLDERLSCIKPISSQPACPTDADHDPPGPRPRPAVADLGRSLASQRRRRMALNRVDGMLRCLTRVIHVTA